MAIYKDVESLCVVTYQGENEDFDRGVKFILEKLDALPTVDIVEVVRCDECENGKEYPNCVICHKLGTGTNKKFYCADGIIKKE